MEIPIFPGKKNHQNGGFFPWRFGDLLAFLREQFFRRNKALKAQVSSPEVHLRSSLPLFFGGDVVVSGRGFHFIFFFGGEGGRCFYIRYHDFFSRFELKTHPPTHWHDFFIAISSQIHINKKPPRKTSHVPVYLPNYLLISRENQPYTSIPWIGKYTCSFHGSVMGDRSKKTPPSRGKHLV